ncbi:dihydropteroate synthase [Aliiruegeria haliotis]|uniref:Dihydropteroate synthase n=1 Tax=Aliiruegeria haliotis TaxID=1280846 RepID=A0A2T0RV04_9RHOB|nr:dihydropteroate synthase [Aliiruegeria haliotis]PRY25025.1 dihydropteroate synthase [Aliiruegeria haliotis]
MRLYYRPIPKFDIARPATAESLAGGWCWFDRVEVLRRDAAPQVVPAAEIPGDALRRLTGPRPDLGLLRMDCPSLMGILNVTPDSFSDGGRHHTPTAALARATEMAQMAEVIDIGGESTRPGAAEVAIEEEIARTAPVIAAMRDAGLKVSISIDTRKAPVAAAALDAGADLVNDVAGLGFDTELAPLVASRDVPVCIMHSIETPVTMQDDPRYDDVLLDVYDALEARIAQAEASGIARRRIIADPGIGFGKTLEHNLALLARLSLFHALGCPILLGASRKRFIGTIGGAAEACDRGPGSVAVALAGVAQGVQILRVHDVLETRQALRLFQAVGSGTAPREAI